MKRQTLSAILATALLTSAWAESTMAEQWRCVVEKKVGANVSNDLAPAGFYLEGEEFRIADKATAVEQYGIDLEHTWTATGEDRDYFVRKASDDPRSGFSWYGVKAARDTKKGETPTALWTDDTADALMGSLRVDVESGRFQHTAYGSYVWDGSEGADPVFSFGTCRPYYD